VDVLPREIIQTAPDTLIPESPLPISGGALTVSVSESGEQQAISKAMRMAGGNLSIAAVMLGISRSTLYRKMNQYGLKRISPIEIKLRSNEGGLGLR
jgi:transcriptional regulator of acetoin/glycerol metabolism